MKRLSHNNINTASYWDRCYSDPNRRKEYLDTTSRFNRAAAEVNNGDKVLDIGCGVGVFTKLVADTYPGCEVWGTDISPKVCQDNARETPSIKYIPGEIGRLELPQNYFDFIFCGEVIEHLDDPALLFTEAQRLLKVGGKLVISTPNRNEIGGTEHIWEFDHEDISKLYTEHGFTDPRFIYLPYGESIFVIMAAATKL